MPKLWNHQVRGLKEAWAHVQAGEKRICITSPTGGGKTFLMREIIEECQHTDRNVALYTNRIMLTSQTSGVLDRGDVEHGIRAAGFETELGNNVQICSLQTEYARCVRRKQWDLHDADIVLIDEAHSLRAATANHIFNKHVANGATLIGFTATPLNIGHIYTKLVVAGTNTEMRKCGAHVPCITYGPDEPDLRHIGRTKTGEFVQGDVCKAIHRQSLYGRVVKWWKKLNPDGKPTILFAPGVSESKWFCDQFANDGITAAHVDGKHIYMGGVEHQSTPELRAAMLHGSRTGEIKILCNRFVLREGIDAPWLAHCIMATPFGSITSYLQAGGRLLRSAPGLDHVILQDHGGNWNRLGSLNEDRQWSLAFDEMSYSSDRERTRKEAGEKEPICCTQCGFIRKSGGVCPSCGHKCTFSFKNVIQIDGTLKQMTAVQYHKNKVKRQLSSDQKTWYKCYFSILSADKRDPFKNRSMRVVAAYFKNLTGHWPDPGLNGVPKRENEWSMPIQAYQSKVGGYKG